MGENDEALISPDSAAEITDVAVEASPEAPDAAAASSPAEGEKPTDVLSIVRDAVVKKPEAEKASPAEERDTAEPEEGAAAARKTTEPNDDYTDVPFHKHPRFKQLISERNALRGDADQFRQVQAFLETNGLTGDEAASMLQVAALAKRDPAAAWQQMRPFVQDVLLRSGEYLPDDLRARVQKGELSQTDAREISRLRAQAATMQTRTQFEQQQAEREAQRRQAESMRTAALSWETDVRRRDPDFDAKVEDVQKEVLWLQRREGMPKDAAGVAEQLKTAYATVNKRLKAAQPRKPEVRAVGGGTVAGTPQTEPKSVLEIIQRAGAA